NLTDMNHLISRKSGFWSRSLESDCGHRDPRVDSLVDRTIVAGRRITQEQRVAHGGVESVADQALLLPLEGRGDIERAAKPDEDRKRINWNPTRHVFREHFEIETPVHHQRRHARAAVGARHGNPVGRRVENAGAAHDRVVHLAGCDILPLPAERIANPGDEIVVTMVVDLHEIAGAEPDVACRKDITQDLLFGLDRIGIALKMTSALRGGTDTPDRVADLAGGAGDTEPVPPADRVAFGVDPHDRSGEAVRQQWRDTADRAGFSFDIEQREVAFRRGVEFEYLRNRDPS